MKTLALMAVSLTVLQVPSGEKLYNKLQYRFEQDQTECFEYAKKMQKKYPEKPEPYLFLTYEALGKFDQSKTLEKQYRYLNSATRDMAKVVKFSQSNSYFAQRRDSLILHISNQVGWMRDSFFVLEDQESFESITKSYSRMTNNGYLKTWDELVQEKEQKEAEARAKRKKEEEERLAIIQIARVEDGKYYGKPIGNENITAVDAGMEKEIMRILNEARVKRGMKPYTWDNDLARSARYHANDMATQNYFSHNSHDSINGELVEVCKTFDRIRSFYHDKGFANGENIAAGSNNAFDTYMQWFNSPGHNAIMFTKESKYIGIGMAKNPHSTYGYYWVMCTAQ
ncbi:MAG: CAP domain-containing protein [Flavobacteriales bacterium]|nr:CAP domain-containing protein [Flavobacteriales bacterium]